MENKKQRAEAWFTTLRDQICAEFEGIEREDTDNPEPAGFFERKNWKRTDLDGSDGGGGEISLMYGRV